MKTSGAEPNKKITHIDKTISDGPRLDGVGVFFGWGFLLLFFVIFFFWKRDKDDSDTQTTSQVKLFFVSFSFRLFDSHRHRFFVCLFV